MDLNPDIALTAGAELEASATSLLQQLHGDVVIVDVRDLERAVEDRHAIGEAIKRVETFFDPLTKAAFRMHRLLTDRRRDVLAPLQRVDQQLATAIGDFKRRADRQREEQERAQAEQQRRDDESRAAAAAAVLEQRGQPEVAAAVLAEAIAAPLPTVVLPDVVKEVNGLKFRRYWKWRLTREQLLPREYLTPDVKRITAVVNAMKNTTRIPGIEVFYIDEPIR